MQDSDVEDYEINLPSAFAMSIYFFFCLLFRDLCSYKVLTLKFHLVRISFFDSLQPRVGVGITVLHPPAWSSAINLRSDISSKPILNNIVIE
jgi:hypothetical protein